MKTAIKTNKRAVYLAAIFAVVAVLPLLIKDDYFISVMNQALINAVVVLGLNFITGLTGQMNLGTAGIFALGAYASALLNVKLGLSPWVGMVAAVIIGYGVGMCLGYPSLRIRGVYLSLTTIGFTEIVRLLLNNLVDLTGGTQGVRNISPFSIFGLRIHGHTGNYYFLFVFLILLSIISYRIVYSKWGRALKALSDNPDAAESLGINVSGVKIMAFTLAAIYGCIGGSLYVHMTGYVNPAMFNMDMSIRFVIMLMVGGIGLVRGNIVGAFIVTLLPEALRFLGDYYQLAFYSIVLLGAIFLPNGWFSVIGIVKDLAKRKQTEKGAKE